MNTEIPQSGTKNSVPGLRPQLATAIFPRRSSGFPAVVSIASRPCGLAYDLQSEFIEWIFPHLVLKYTENRSNYCACLLININQEFRKCCCVGEVASSWVERCILGSQSASLRMTHIFQADSTFCQVRFDRTLLRTERTP